MGIVEKLAEKAPLVRPGDEMSEHYDSHDWFTLGGDSINDLIYNLDRHQFELTQFGDSIAHWLHGLSDEQPIADVLKESRTIKGRYGLKVAVWYTKEHILSRTQRKMKDIIKTPFEFIYDEVPYGIYFPFIEHIIDW